jgi:hypothetical protein
LAPRGAFVFFTSIKEFPMRSFSIPPSADGALVVLNSGRCRKTVFDRAFLSLGLSKLLPRREKRAMALGRAIRQHLGKAGKRSRWEIVPLDRAVLGFEVLRETKGVESNTHDYQFTVKADASDRVSVTVAGMPMHGGQEIEAIYRDRLDYYEASTVGSLLVRAMTKAWSATSLRDGGGVYFLAGGLLQTFTDLARQIEEGPTNPDSEVRLSVARFPLMDNPDIAREAVRAFTAEVAAMRSELEADLLGGHDMTKGGIARRKDDIENAKQKIAAFQQMFGVGLHEVSMVVEALDTKFAMLELADISA